MDNKKAKWRRHTQILSFQMLSPKNKVEDKEKSHNSIDVPNWNILAAFSSFTITVTFETEKWRVILRDWSTKFK